MPGTELSFEQSRKSMLEAISRNCDGQEVKKKVPFRSNEDVPRFLARLDRLEEKARRSRLIVE